MPKQELKISLIALIRVIHEAFPNKAAEIYEGKEPHTFFIYCQFDSNAEDMFNIEYNLETMSVDEVPEALQEPLDHILFHNKPKEADWSDEAYEREKK